jgi:uncharacterized protein
VSSFVQALFVYPVKSCRGIALERARVQTRGLQHDRRWMIVDTAGTFVTQRTEPRLARVDVAIDEAGAGLSLCAPELEALRLPLVLREGAPRRVRVWNDEVDALDAGEAAARWVSELLGARGALVFMPDRTQRPVTPKLAKEGDLVAFADAFPLLVATTASLADLNARLDHPLPMDRFRPNIVVDASVAWAEDDWSQVRIGDVPVRIVKGCDRCVVTTIDQRTAERSAEPLRTLATFRARENKVYFGMNGVPDAYGEIARGDPVTVIA